LVLAIQVVAALLAFAFALLPDRRRATPPDDPTRVPETERVPEPV
jgi:hypothetical protein